MDDEMSLLQRKMSQTKDDLSAAIEGSALALLAARTGLPATKSHRKPQPTQLRPAMRPCCQLSCSLPSHVDPTDDTEAVSPAP